MVLVACGKRKRSFRSKAGDLYIGSLFRKAKAWAEREGDEWGILSAEHGLLLPEDEIDPYEKTLRSLSRDDYRRWCLSTRKEISIQWPKAHLVCLAGKLYRGGVPDGHEAPLEGLGMGRQMAWLKVN